MDLDLDLTGSEVSPAPIGRPGSIGAAAAPVSRSLVMALLALDGALCAVTTALLLPSYLGTTPFPVSALAGGLVNAALVWTGLHWAPTLRLAALPLWMWLLTVAMIAFGGPGDDLIFTGRGLMAFGILAMLALGTAPPLWMLWRWRNALSKASALS